MKIKTETVININEEVELKLPAYRAVIVGEKICRVAIILKHQTNPGIRVIIIAPDYYNDFNAQYLDRYEADIYFKQRDWIEIVEEHFWNYATIFTNHHFENIIELYKNKETSL